MADYWQLYNQAKAFYSSIGKLFCPALGREIIFDHRGFRHILRKGNDERSHQDQIRRFKILLNIRNILPTARMDKSNREGFYRLVSNFEGVKVKIVVMQLENNDRCFISIM